MIIDQASISFNSNNASTNIAHDLKQKLSTFCNDVTSANSVKTNRINNAMPRVSPIDAVIDTIQCC